MNNEEQVYLLALSYIQGIGNSRLKKLLQHYSSPKDVWLKSAKDLIKETGLTAKIISKVGDNKFIQQAKKELELCVKNDYSYYTFLDEDYPKLLKECVDSPPFLFTRGNINWNTTKFVSIVGTRKMTSYGRDYIKTLLEGFKGLDICIVSGLALGVDVTAHKTAMDMGLQTIGVLAHGVNNIFPKTNEKIGLQMMKNGGVLSEFSSFHVPEPENFKKRNRIIAGLSQATIVIESDFRGGAMSTATHANQYNRDVFALPGRVSDKYSRGCHLLIKSHKAFLLTEANDVLSYLNLTPSVVKAEQKQLFIELSVMEQKLFDLIRENGKMHLDSIAINLEMSGFELLPSLLDLELKNVIKPLSGKMYELT